MEQQLYMHASVTYITMLGMIQTLFTHLFTLGIKREQQDFSEAVGGAESYGEHLQVQHCL